MFAGVSNCEGLAIDWIGDNIFWTDEGLKTINVARLDNTSVWKVLVSDNMSHPQAIVLQPRRDRAGAG